MSKPMKKEYAERIKPRVDELGLSPEEFAKAIGASVRDVYHWNSDGYGTFSKFLHEIADLLNVSVPYLKMETDDPSPISKENARQHGADGQELVYRDFLMSLCGEDQKKFQFLQDAYAKNPEKTKANFDLFLKTL